MEQISSYSAQAAVLGTFLANSYEVWNYAKDLQPVMFEAEPDRLVYSVIHECSLQGLEPNLIIVKQMLENKGILHRAGGQAYLESLIALHQPVKHMPLLVSRIQKDYKRRRLNEINAGIPELLNNPGQDVDEVISRLHVELDNLAREINTPDVSRVSETITETIERIKERRKHPGIRGLSTGIDRIDNLTSGYNGSELWYIGARPSHGKSAWLVKTALNVAGNGHGVLIFNREMNVNDINERIISIISQVPLQDIRLGTISEEQVHPIENAKKIVDEMPIFVDNNFSNGMEYIIATIRKFHQLYDIKVVGIDYIQLIVERNTESTHLLGQASRQLKMLAGELDITIIVLSQLNREVEKREDKRPLMGDLRQSGNLEEDADIMIGLYRDEMYLPGSPDEGKMEFLIRKSRNGPTGTVVLKFDKDTVNITHDKLDSWGEESFI